jgi:ATP-dependent Clp protease adaptor protein ClpS
MSRQDTATKIRVNVDVTEPPMFRVIYINDDKTSVQFVIETLINFFNYNPEAAEHITVDIHQQGSAVVAVLPYEIAEQKGLEVTMSARSNGFPLQIKLEPDSN